MSRIKFLFFLIIILASVLRFYQLGKTPVSLEWDEVAIGYDAYSILHTGRDQFGKLMPITFRSLDDYKPPIYEYLTVPSVALFGLNSFSVRLPSAISGIIAVIATYWLLLTITSEIPRLKSQKYKLSLLASLFLAVSPWHLQFSRAAFEVNLSVCMTIIAVTLFIKGIRNPKLFMISAVMFGLDFFSYHSTRVVAPLLLVTLFLLFNRKLPSKKIIISFFMIFGFFFLSFIPILISPDAQIRFKATNIFNPGARYLDEKDLEKDFLDSRLMDKSAGFETAGKIFHNQRLIYTDYDTLKKALGKYLSHFNFEFLFVKGDAPLHHAPGFGLLYLWELPFIIVGLIYIFSKGLNKYSLVILMWILYAPIPASVTREAPHAVRTELIIPTFQMITAIGVIAVLKLFANESKWVIQLFSLIIISVFAINFSFYLHQYYVHTNFKLSQNWKYGREEAVSITESLKQNYDKVIVSIKLEMPHIFWLFFTKYSPEVYLKNGGTTSGGFAVEENHFDKYEFRNFTYNSLPQNQKLLLVGIPQDFPPDAKILKTIYYLDGSKALVIAQN